MRALLARFRLVQTRSEGGWVMMDAVWSSVVVIMAFMATFMALDNGTKTASKDIKKTTSYDIAQNELNYLRDLGKTSLTSLLAKNNTNTAPTSPSKTVTIGGQSYDVWYSAYYVTGLGNNATDACGGTYAANGQGTAKYIYIKVTVDYDGITWSGGTPSSPLSVLDTYFSPEGGDTNAATGTLRVYLLNRNNSPYVGTSVTLTATGVGMTFAQQTQTTGASGCVLFTGLPRGAFNIAVTTSKYDIYLNNPTATLLNVPINLPDRAAISKDIKMESPMKFNPEFWTNNGTTDMQVTPTTSTTTGPPTLVGSWIGRSGKILTSSGTDFTTNPGTTFMPHTWLPSYAQNYMYPEPNGYDMFPGPCDVNEPAAAALMHIPSVGNATYGPGSAAYLEAGVNPRFYLPQLRTRIYIADRTDGTLVKDKAIRASGTWPNFGARELIKLKGMAGASGASSGANCGPRGALFNTWQRMKGTMNSPILTANPNTPREYLADDAEVLPTGKYDVCLSAYVTGTQRTSASSSWQGLMETRYKLFSGVDLSASLDLSWDPFSTDYTLTDCAGGSSQWSP